MREIFLIYSPQKDVDIITFFCSTVYAMSTEGLGGSGCLRHDNGEYQTGRCKNLHLIF